MLTASSQTVPLFVLCSLLLVACDDSNSASDRNPSEHKIVPANGQTFLLNSKEGRVYVLRDHEFVELSTREPKSAPTSEAVKEISSQARDLEVTARLKFHDEKLLFFIDLAPQKTEEYKAYEKAEIEWLVKFLSQEMAQEQPNKVEEPAADQAASTNIEPQSTDNPPSPPSEKYLNKNWHKYWENGNNFVRAHLQDTDEFPVTSIEVSLLGGVLNKTQIVDNDEKPVGYNYYGEIPMSFPAFQRIERLRVTWNLEAKK